MITSTLRNWGGSVALPIPKKLLALAALEAGSEVTVDVRDGKLVIEAARPRFTLEQLMKEHRAVGKALRLARDDEWLDSPDLPSERI